MISVGLHVRTRVCVAVDKRRQQRDNSQTRVRKAPAIQPPRSRCIDASDHLRRMSRQHIGSIGTCERRRLHAISESIASGAEVEIRSQRLYRAQARDHAAKATTQSKPSTIRLYLTIHKSGPHLDYLSHVHTHTHLRGSHAGAQRQHGYI
jgi:hypothetical protein